MSLYTTQLRTICQALTHDSDSDPFEVIQKSAPLIFDFNFPIFDEDYRLPLEIKILSHFYTREIGEETVPLWKFRLRTKLNEIMPLYNRIYESELTEYNPVYTHDLTRTSDRRGSNDTTSSSNTTNQNWTLFSDTPQGGLDGLDSEEYLTNATKNTGTGNQSDNTKATTLDEYIERVQGYDGGKTASALLREFRENLINTDMLVIAELEPLFMQLW